MYKPTAREWALIKQALAIHGLEMARAAMGTKKDGSPLYLNSQIREVNEINALLKKMGTTPRLVLISSNEQIKPEVAGGPGPSDPDSPAAA